MSNKISSITLTNFKGATRPFKCEFDTNKNITMLFGENGSGKSTLVDALDFVFNEKIGSLGQISVGHSPYKYLSSIGSQLQNVTVDVEINLNVIRGRISNNGEISSPKPAEIPSVEILRRNQILNIILAEPKNRFDEIKKFIDVQKCQNNEDALRKAKDEVKKDKDDAYRYFQIADEQLKKLWEEDGSKLGDHLKWSADQSKHDTTEVENYVAQATEFIAKSENCSAGLLEIEQSTDVISAKQTEFTSVETSYEDVKKDLIKNADHLIDTLEKAKIYIDETPDITKCPVCEKPNTQPELLTQVVERLKSYSAPIALKKKIEELKKNLHTNQIQLSSQKDNTLKKIIDFISFINNNDIKEIKQLNIELNDYPLVVNSFVKFDNNCFDEAVKLYNLFIQPKAEIKIKLDKYIILVKRLSEIKRNLQLRNEKVVVYNDRVSQLKKLESLHEIAERVRKEFLDEVLLKISNSIDEYYQRLHPDENIGSIRCSMKSHGINSMEIVGKFHSIAECPPAAYYSESHLDTLGICIFIALAKHYNSNGTILVFDDVLTSIDVNHLQRFINFLTDISKEFNQIIVTTHYRPWREKYKYAKGPSANIDMIELNNWNLDKGISFVRTFSCLEELRFYMSDKNFDRQITSMKSGILLESLLDNLTWIYDCKLRRKANIVPTIQDLFSGINKELKNALITEAIQDDKSIIKLEIKGILAELESTNMVRNTVGAHYNEIGIELPDSEVKNFGNAIIKLYEALICHKCGEMPQSEKSGSYRECYCGFKRMHPFQQPK